MYLSSRSHSSPPTPNKALRNPSSFSAREFDIVESGTLDAEEHIRSDRGLIASPLPHPHRQTAFAAADGIGDKTARALLTTDIESSTIEQLAWSLFGDGPDTAREVTQALAETHKPNALRDRLEAVYDEQVDD